ncbi:MAG: DUF4249 domain-containing protein, partial [Flavobacterium sp.]
TMPTDPNNSGNYLYKYQYSTKVTVSYSVVENKFFQGNEYYSSSGTDDLKIGDVIELKHSGISKQYYNYMNILIGVIGGSGGLFQTPAATVRGNMKNITNPENYPLGYFSLGETDSRSYVIQ